MDCRHVWSVPDPMVDLGEMTIATCLRCHEQRLLTVLLQEGIDSMKEGRGRTNAEVEADFARRREGVDSMPCEHDWVRIFPAGVQLGCPSWLRCQKCGTATKSVWLR